MNGRRVQKRGWTIGKDFGIRKQSICSKMKFNFEIETSSRIETSTATGDSKSVELELRPAALHHKNQFGTNKNYPINSETKSVLFADIKH